MAIIKNQILGQISGKIGDVVHRNRYGKTVAYLLPSRYKASQSVQAKEGRNKFALSVAFAKTVISLDELKHIWKIARLDGVVAYNRIIKYNRNLASGSTLTLRNIITPSGRSYNIYFAEMDKEKALVKFLPEGNDYKSGDSFLGCYVIYLYNPRTKPAIEYQLFSGKVNCTFDKLNNIYSSEIMFNTIMNNELKKYKNTILYFSGLKSSYKKNEVYWTSTYSKQFVL